MGLTVRDIMNPQLLYVGEDEPPEAVRAKMLSFGVSGVPVLDRMYRAVGFISLRDIAPNGQTMHVTTPPITAHPSEPIETAAARLLARNIHHLVVINDRGVAVGVASALDFVRALAGIPARHPSSFDAECVSGDAFHDDEPLQH